MKTTIRLSVLLIVALAIFSCRGKSKDGDIDPKDVLPEEIFSTPQKSQQIIDSLYLIGTPRFYVDATVHDAPTAGYGGYMSGFFDNEFKGQAEMAGHAQKLSINSQNVSSELNKMWNEPYDAILLANRAIVGIAKSPTMSDELKDEMIAQARFFRAFNYFYLAKTFGGVPLVQEPYTSRNKILSKRNSLQEVYDLIVKDLEFAISIVPDDSFGGNQFKITKTTAQTVLLDVYLTMSGYPLQNNHYAEAAIVGKSIIGSGLHGMTLHDISLGLESAYNRLKKPTPAFSEFLFLYQSPSYAPNFLTAHSMPNRAAAWGLFKYDITNNGYRPVQEYLNVYDSVPDLRMHERQFFHSKYSYTLSGGIIVTQSFAKSPWYWFDSNAMGVTGKSFRAGSIYRYPDVMLMTAEAIAESEGVTQEAVNYLTTVRRRAYVNTSTAVIQNSLKSLSKQKFVEEVWLERMRELPFEMTIWPDIQRTRKYPITSKSSRGKALFVDVVGATNPWGYNFRERHLLFPIPIDELQRNKNLKQNPGY